MRQRPHSLYSEPPIDLELESACKLRGKLGDDSKETSNKRTRRKRPKSLYGHLPLARNILLSCIAGAGIFLLLSSFSNGENERLRQENIDLKEKLALCNKNNNIDDYKREVVGKKEEEGDSIVEELHRVVSPERLHQLSTKYKQIYKSAQPFPHIAIDDIFPTSILQKVISEHPESALGKNGCLPGSKCFQQSKQNKKSGIDVEEKMGTYTRILFSFLKSSIFTKFLEDISGIRNIIPDPHFRGSGLHFTSTGGNLDIHADFNRYKDYELDRRVNMFIYLNDDWSEEYGGHLELWSRDMKSCYQRIKPKLGRFVVFSSTDFSYHGHPEPILAPEGRARRSLALYYYTNGRPQNECLNDNCAGKGHSTLFQKPVGCKKCLDDTCRRDDTIDTPVWMASINAL